MCVQCHTRTRPVASPRYDTLCMLIYCIISSLHLIANKLNLGKWVHINAILHIGENHDFSQYSHRDSDFIKVNVEYSLPSCDFDCLPIQ